MTLHLQIINFIQLNIITIIFLSINFIFLARFSKKIHGIISIISIGLLIFFNKKYLPTLHINIFTILNIIYMFLAIYLLLIYIVNIIKWYKFSWNKHKLFWIFAPIASLVIYIVLSHHNIAYTHAIINMLFSVIIGFIAPIVIFYLMALASIIFPNKYVFITRRKILITSLLIATFIFSITSINYNSALIFLSPQLIKVLYVHYSVLMILSISWIIYASYSLFLLNSNNIEKLDNKNFFLYNILPLVFTPFSIKAFYNAMILYNSMFLSTLISHQLMYLVLPLLLLVSNYKYKFSLAIKVFILTIVLGVSATISLEYYSIHESISNSVNIFMYLALLIFLGFYPFSLWIIKTYKNINKIFLIVLPIFVMATFLYISPIEVPYYIIYVSVISSILLGFYSTIKKDIISILIIWFFQVALVGVILSKYNNIIFTSLYFYQFSSIFIMLLIIIQLIYKHTKTYEITNLKNSIFYGSPLGLILLFNILLLLGAPFSLFFYGNYFLIYSVNEHLMDLLLVIIPISFMLFNIISSILQILSFRHGVKNRYKVKDYASILIPIIFIILTILSIYSMEAATDILNYSTLLFFAQVLTLTTILIFLKNIIYFITTKILIIEKYITSSIESINKSLIVFVDVKLSKKMHRYSKKIVKKTMIYMPMQYYYSAGMIIIILTFLLYLSIFYKIIF